MELRKVVGQVTPEERTEIQALFERKNGLAELAKIVSADNNELYEKLVKDIGPSIDIKNNKNLYTSHDGQRCNKHNEKIILFG